MLSSVILAAASYLLVPFFLKKNSDKKYKDTASDENDNFTDQGADVGEAEDHQA